MTRITVPLLCAGCFVAGLAVSPHLRVSAQEGASASAPTAIDGKGLFFSSEDLKKRFPMADKTGKFSNDPDQATAKTNNQLAWEPTYRFTYQRRQYFDPAQKNDVSGEMLNWAGSEMHENKTQIYAIHQGTGAVVLGGKPGKDHVGADGQHSGGSLQGGTTYKVKAGDFIVIPPRTWHQVQPDRGQTIAYGMCHIETRRMMP